VGKLFEIGCGLLPTVPTAAIGAAALDFVPIAVLRGLCVRLSIVFRSDCAWASERFGGLGRQPLSFADGTSKPE